MITKLIFFITLICFGKIDYGFSKEFLILQSTTSARDSGLYEFLLPEFFKKFAIEVIQSC